MKKSIYIAIIMGILICVITVFGYNKYNQYATQKVDLVRVVDGDTVVVSNFCIRIYISALLALIV